MSALTEQSCHKGHLLSPDLDAGPQTSMIISSATLPKRHYIVIRPSHTAMGIAYVEPAPNSHEYQMAHEDHTTRLKVCIRRLRSQFIG